MGEISQTFLNGEVCCICGEYTDQFLKTGQDYGHPVACKQCYSELSEADKEYYIEEY